MAERFSIDLSTNVPKPSEVDPPPQRLSFGIAIQSVVEVMKYEWPTSHASVPDAASAPVFAVVVTSSLRPH